MPAEATIAPLRSEKAEEPEARCDVPPERPAPPVLERPELPLRAECRICRDDKTRSQALPPSISGAESIWYDHAKQSEEPENVE
jgi:hypothetical protein